MLGATLALDRSNNFGLQVFCRNNRAEGTKELMLSMYVNNDAKVSPTIAKFKQGRETHANTYIDVCINSRCRNQSWVHIDEGQSFGAENPLVIGNTHEKIRSLGITVPDDAHYEFHGNVDTILGKICADY